MNHERPNMKKIHFSFVDLSLADYYSYFTVGTHD